MFKHCWPSATFALGWWFIDFIVVGVLEILKCCWSSLINESFWLNWVKIVEWVSCAFSKTLFQCWSFLGFSISGCSNWVVSEIWDDVDCCDEGKPTVLGLVALPFLPTLIIRTGVVVHSVAGGETTTCLGLGSSGVPTAGAIAGSQTCEDPRNRTDCSALVKSSTESDILLKPKLISAVSLCMLELLTQLIGAMAVVSSPALSVSATAVGSSCWALMVVSSSCSSLLSIEVGTLTVSCPLGKPCGKCGVVFAEQVPFACTTLDWVNQWILCWCNSIYDFIQMSINTLSGSWTMFLHRCLWQWCFVTLRRWHFHNLHFAVWFQWYLLSIHMSWVHSLFCYYIFTPFLLRSHGGTIHNVQSTIHDSQFTIHSSQFKIHDSLLMMH